MLTGEEVKGETPIYRYAGMKPDEPLNDSMPYGAQDMNKIIEHAVKEFAKLPVLGTRQLIKGKPDEEGE